MKKTESPIDALLKNWDLNHSVMIIYESLSRDYIVV